MEIYKRSSGWRLQHRSDILLAVNIKKQWLEESPLAVPAAVGICSYPVYALSLQDVSIRNQILVRVPQLRQGTQPVAQA